MIGWITPADAQHRIGHELGVSEWFLIDQKRVDSFADATEDWQFIHVDPEQAQASPFRGTIAHGFLALALLTRLMPPEAIVLKGIKMGVNYGFNRVRFLSPVPVGKRIRARHKLLDISDKGAGRWLITTDVTLEIENVEKPALMAEWLGMQFC